MFVLNYLLGNTLTEDRRVNILKEQGNLGLFLSLFYVSRHIALPLSILRILSF